MARVVVDVMLKPEISDPQGQAVLGAIVRLGHRAVHGVRQGKRFELEVEEPVDEAAMNEIADTLLANPVIEDYIVAIQPAGGESAVGGPRGVGRRGRE